MPRILFTLVTVVAGAAAPGCAVKWSQEGLCFKPLFRVRVELNRHNGETGHGAADCNCIDGGGGEMIDSGIMDGTVPPGAFVTGGPVTVQTEPLGAPILPGALTDHLLSAANPPAPPPVFGPNAGQTQPAASPPSSTTGGGTTQAAKRRPGSLQVSTGIQNDHANRSGEQPSTLRTGQRTVFGVYVYNQGDEAIALTQLQGTFTANIKPISVMRLSGPDENQLRQSTSNARIEGQRVIFDRFTSFGPETRHEYQITCEIVGAGPGNFEVTNLEGPQVKKNTPITATGQ